MPYIQGFVIPVPEEKKDAYFEMARATAPIFQEYGALEVVECWGDGLSEGETTSFRRAVKAEAGENVVFSWIVWPSKEVQAAAHEKIWSDPRMDAPEGGIPFDGKRMIFGGFVPEFQTAKRSD